MADKREADRINKIIEKYFDTDITDADSAMDVLLDNGVDHVTAREIAESMYPRDTTK